VLSPIGIGEHADSHQPIANTNVQQYGTNLLMFHYKFHFHNGTCNKVNVKEKIVCVDN
jgi:hypothetical protein